MSLRRALKAVLALTSMSAALAVVVPDANGAPSTAPSVVDYSQCANGTGTSLACVGWINGTLITNNSHYREDDVTPQRAVVSVPAAGSGTTQVHSFTFTYMARKDNASAHAYDS